MDDEQFRKLLAYLDLSFPGYRKVRKGVKKRIGRHMQSFGCRNVTEYSALLDSNPDVRGQCDLLMKVSISHFFRDRLLWQMLETCYLPLALSLQPPIFRVWSAGCAGGEEPYSFHIIWQNLGRKILPLPPLELLASDADQKSLERAAAGIYPAASLKEVDQKLRLDYFESLKAGHLYRIKSDLATGIQWVCHDFEKDPLPGPFQIIFLRNNLLTYDLEIRTVPALQRILSQLTTGGLLLIGRNEFLPEPIRAHYQPLALPYMFQKAC